MSVTEVPGMWVTLFVDKRQAQPNNRSHSTINNRNSYESSSSRQPSQRDHSDIVILAERDGGLGSLCRVSI